MTRVTPTSATAYSGQLEDHEPYPARLTAIDWITSSEQYGGERRLQLDWQVGNESIRDWVSVRLGKQQSGQVSKLRALLNALVGKPEGTEIAWFDDETLDFSYDGKDPYYGLKVGANVIIRGVTSLKEDGSKRFSIKVYQHQKDAQEDAPEPVAASPKKDADGDEKPPW